MNDLRLQKYTVKKGDTLWKIASLYQVGVTELINANPQIPDPDLIYIGQVVNIPAGSTYRDMEQEIIRLVNQERQNRGLSPLSENWEISRVARIKSQDMIDYNYFSHNSPVYGTPFKMLSDFGIKFTQAAENIASGQTSAQQVMNSWMNSSGHRANILNSNFNQIGVGVARASNGTYYFTQIFIRS
ncbi:MAG: CAP domain-containing protein [Bacilli bacterium]|nr:CAP domain-containing protein [Bacilli bacterium]